MRKRITLGFLGTSFLFCSFLFCTSLAMAAPITLFNTGVNGLGVVLGDAATDTHYSIIGTGAGSGITISAINIPGTYIPNSGSSRWIWQQSDGQPINVTRTFRMSFDLTGLLPGTASLAGSWATDNFGDDIKINGTSTSQTCGGFSAYCNFSVNTGFIAGINTLDFVVRDVGSIAGFRVDAIRGSATAASTTPEPLSLGLVGIGLAALGLARRKR